MVVVLVPIGSAEVALALRLLSGGSLMEALPDLPTLVTPALSRLVVDVVVASAIVWSAALEGLLLAGLAEAQPQRLPCRNSRLAQ